MVDVPMMHNMEDFLINPTMLPVDDFSPLPRAKGKHMSVTPPNERFIFRSDLKTPEPSATIRDLISLPDFWHGYTSDEEIASPIDGDDMSFHSLSDSSDQSGDHSDVSFVEQLATSCNKVEQQCNKAQAVTLVKMPKARVVSMPKIVEHPGPMRVQQPTMMVSSRPASARASPRSSHRSTPRHSRQSSLQRSNDKLASADAFKGYFDQPQSRRQLQRQPSTPLLGATSTSSLSDTAPKTPPVRQSVDVLGRDSSPEDEGWPLPNTPLPKRKLHKFSSSFSLGMFGKLRRNNSEDSNTSDGLRSFMENEASIHDFVPSRTSSKSRAMLPRGASERAPAITLPTYPDEGVRRFESYSMPRTHTRHVSAQIYRLPEIDTEPLDLNRRPIAAALG